MYNYYIIQNIEIALHKFNFKKILWQFKFLKNLMANNGENLKFNGNKM